MHYLHHVRAYLIRLPFLLGAMAAGYMIGMYLGWREPVQDISKLIPVFFGGIVTYLFIIPYIRTKG